MEREGQRKSGRPWALSDTFQCALIQSIWQANMSSFVVSFSMSQQDKTLHPSICITPLYRLQSAASVSKLGLT